MTSNKFDKLTEWFLKNGDNVLVALSGGVDSAVIALAAKKARGNKALAVTANYKTLSDEELSTAKKIADEIGITHRVIKYNELKNSEFIKNDEMRCYYCRSELTHYLLQEARKFRINLVVDGTNVDDLKDIRPGIKALREKGVRSPMVELGIGKSDIRSIAQQNGLSVHNKPSNACLASRIPHGMEITYEKLKKIEKSEIIVKSIFNVRQVRVRDHGEVARIEVGNNEITKLFYVDKLALVDTKLKELGFKFVSIDAIGYRTGNFVLIGK
jgi:pyridinium-3,5-biscarboxylic acid mononucleotide sulfurtransferase